MFADEIRQQPEALRDVVRHYRGEGGAALDRVAELYREATGQQAASGRIFVTGMGSSLYAAEAALPGLLRAGIDARSVEAGEWLHYGLEPLPPGSLVIAVSQSGESVETRTVAERLSGRTALAAVTNDTGSRMARAANVVLPIQAGHEAMIAAKTQTNTAAVLLLAASALSDVDRKRVLDSLQTAEEAMEKALDPSLDPLIETAAGLLDDARSVHAVARGPALTAARAGALVLGEGSRLAVTALPAGSFRHGPLELAGPGHAAIVFAPAGPTRGLLEGLVNDLIRAGSRVVLLTDEPTQRSDPNLVLLPVGDVPDETYFSLPAAILIERLLVAIAGRRGLTPGQFQYGGKITERE